MSIPKCQGQRSNSTTATERIACGRVFSPHLPHLQNAFENRLVLRPIAELHGSYCPLGSRLQTNASFSFSHRLRDTSVGFATPVPDIRHRMMVEMMPGAHSFRRRQPYFGRAAESRELVYVG
jgi:hypothetical protein